MKTPLFGWLALAVICASLPLTTNAQSLQSNLRAYWNFDELNDAGADGPTFGTDYFADQSGNNRHAVIQMEGPSGSFTSTNPQSASGILGGAFRSERGSGHENHHLYTTTPDTDNGLDFSSGDAFTFSLWTQSDYNQSFQRGNYFGKEEQATFDVRNPDSGYLFARSGGNGATTMQFHVNDGSTFTNGEVRTFPNDGTDQWDNGEWALWTLTYDGAGSLDFYVNGNLEDSESLTTGIDWSNNADFTIAHRNGGHQRSFAWPFGAGGEGFIDDFGVIADDTSSSEVSAIYELAADSELAYDLGKVLQLLDLHREADLGAEVLLDDLRWVYTDDPTAFSGGMGELTGGGGDFALQLANGTGVITQAATVPEPTSLAIWAAVGIGLFSFALRRNRSRK